MPSKKIKRIKPKNFVRINSLEETNAALFEIAQLRAKLKMIDAKAEEEINKIKAKASTEAQPHLDRIDALEAGIYAYSEYYKDELFSPRKKTQELQFGLIGYRQSTKISVKRSCLDKLKEYEFIDAIRIQESVNKEVLKDWPDDRLKMVDAKKIVEDKFWYEVKEEAVTETSPIGAVTRPAA